ncbi:MAG: 16S rRNA (cytidine(1402)-2'-O)-methyltransferase [Parcubacteria group bacterium]|nr:16S rRNA (cytidine(1402)-2'-O)-methyltransferase [Parcubacteria group bacterium]|tara:strand:+ start:1329 stop:2024 length:696 start_codon:yes stop_codon:yes gene_type:complete
MKSSYGAIFYMSTLYIVATPIGNLGDISQRALDTLSSVDFVIAEDTRQSGKLLSAYDISKPYMSLHAHTTPRELKSILSRLKTESAALVTDAGTPGIADPGGLLVKAIEDSDDDISIVPIPGASAVVTALSVAGMRANQFTFLGYVPHKKGRNKFFNGIDKALHTVVFFETPHRIGKTLEALSGLSKNRRIVICRELTKMHETIYRTNVSDVKNSVPEDEYRGEFVIVIEV